MTQLQVPLVTLSVQDGLAASESPYLSTAGCENIGRPGVHSFFAILEPLSAHSESPELAPLILDRLEQELVTRQKLTATAAISASVEAVNEELHFYNRTRAEADRLYYGLTCGISRGNDLYLAQVAPSQVLIGQDGELYAFPGLEAWHWSRRTESGIGLEQPMGLHEEIEPDLYHTRIEPGDLVVLCSGSLARVIQREPQDVFLEGDAVAAISHLGDLAEAYNVDNATSAAIAVTDSPVESRKHGDFAVLRRVSQMAASFLPEETAQRLRNRANSSSRPLDLQAEGVQTCDNQSASVDEDVVWLDTISSVSGTSAMSDAGLRNWDVSQLDDDEEYWNPHRHEDFDDADDDYVASEGLHREGKRTLTEILAGAILALSAAVVGVWQLAVNRDRPVDDPREEENTFGLPRLQRYDNSIQRPDFSRVRSRLPRAPISKFTGLVSIGLVFALAIGLFYSISTSRERERVEEFEALVEQATVARQNALQSSDPTVAQAYLQASESRLNEAAALGVDDELLLSEHAAIAEARDSALGVVRLGNIQVLGGIPPAPEGVSPSMFFGNGQLYVLTDALYQLDSEGSRLIRLIGAGDDVGGHTVGELQGAAWGHGSPIAMDGLNLYTYDASSASWSRSELGNFGEAYSDVSAISGYIGNLYILSPATGQILRFHGDQLSALPEDWAAGNAAEELSGAVDMVIDGNIYVLTDAGQVLHFYRGALDETIPVNVTPAIENATAFTYQPDRSHMYIADEHDRILRVTQEGEFVQQFMSAEGAPQMKNIQHIAVDDALGLAYVLADGALLQMRLPGPPR